MFDRVAIINLDRRPDRWERISANIAAIDWPLAEPQRIAAHDGERDGPPEWFQHTAGSWGCLLSHLAVCNQAARNGVGSVLIFEDDAAFPDDFADRYREFEKAVPDDWEALYLGGYHYLDAGLPVPIDERVLQGHCVLGTWAYAIRSRAIWALAQAIKLAPQAVMEDKFGVDRLWGRLHVDKIIRVYTPWRWLVLHGGGLSDTNGRYYRTHDFNMPAATVGQLRAQLSQEALV